MSDIKYVEERDFGFTRPLPPLLMMIVPDVGFVVCGYFDAATYSSLGEAAVVLRGVNTFDEMRGRKIARASDISRKAQEMEITEGMTGRQVLARFQELAESGPVKE